LRRSPVLPIFLIVSVDVLGLTIILPLLPFYAEKLGAIPTVVGLLVSTYAFCRLIVPFMTYAKEIVRVKERHMLCRAAILVFTALALWAQSDTTPPHLQR
jgi:MFS family permease